MGKITTDQIKNSLELDEVLQKAKINHSWDDKATKSAYEWYIKHWYLCIKYPSEPLAAISKGADDLWHQHILDTRKYATDCQQIAGMFLNHTPIYGKPTRFEEAAYEATIVIYEKEFGSVPNDLARTSGDYSYRSPNTEDK